MFCMPNGRRHSLTTDTGPALNRASHHKARTGSRAGSCLAPSGTPDAARSQSDSARQAAEAARRAQAQEQAQRQAAEGSRRAHPAPRGVRRVVAADDQRRGHSKHPDVHRRELSLCGLPEAVVGLLDAAPNRQVPCRVQPIRKRISPMTTSVIYSRPVPKRRVSLRGPRAGVTAWFRRLTGRLLPPLRL